MKANYIDRALLTITLLLSSLTASSQIKIGISGGFDVIDHKISSNIIKVENRVGYHIGPTIEIMPPGLLGIDASLLYGRKEFKATANTGEAIDVKPYNYIMIPLNLKMRVGIIPILGFYASAGGYGAVKLKGGNLHIAQQEFKSKNFEAGVNAEAGVSILKKVDVGLSFTYKLTDNFDNFINSNPVVSTLKDDHPKSWSINATYYF